MAEYQYVAFRAIDRPLSKDALSFMETQSSRAEITTRSFENEYHYGDFRGNAAEMLRRGYDIHLHYANFGIRTLMIRLPSSLPDVTMPYLGDELLKFTPDKDGPGGILSIDPCYEAGMLEEVWDIHDVMNDLVAIRAEILLGDL